MTDPVTAPITAAVIVGLAVSKFTEGAAGEAGKKLGSKLWDTIATRFKGRQKTEADIKKIEASNGKASEAQENLARVLDAELYQDDKFAETVQQLAQQIINLDQDNNQKKTTMTMTNLDNSKGYQVQANRIEHVGDRTTQ